VTDANVTTNVTQSELERARNYLSNKTAGDVVTDSDEGGASIPSWIKIREADRNGTGKTRAWFVKGFGENGGWAKFWHQVTYSKTWCLAVIEGRTSTRVHSGGDNRNLALVFKDTEAELVFAEHRVATVNDDGGIQTSIACLQMRRGYAVFRGIHANDKQHPDELERFDQMVMPKGVRGEGFFNNANRKAEPLNVWHLKPGETLNILDLNCRLTALKKSGGNSAASTDKKERASAPIEDQPQQ
jgi:hypothetical protein